MKTYATKLGYYPQDFLNEVRAFVVCHATYEAQTISYKMEKTLEDAKLEYRLEPRGAYMRKQWLIRKAEAAARGGHFYLYGTTDVHVRPFEIYIFGRDHKHDQQQMAKSLVHEMSHALAPDDNHGPIFRAMCRALGLWDSTESESAYTEPYWLDPAVKKYVDSRPQVEWDY